MSTVGGSTVLPRPRWHRVRLPFPLRFLILATAAFPIWFWFEPAVPGLRDVTAGFVVRVGDLFGLGASAEGGGVVRFDATGSGFRYRVADACTGFAAFGLFSLAVLAFPVSRSLRLFGIVTGAVGLFVLNIVRLVSLGWVGAHRPEYFGAVHHYWWQVFSVVGVAMLWIHWASFSSGERPFLRRTVRSPSGRQQDRLLSPMVVLVGLLAFGSGERGIDVYSSLLSEPVDRLADWLWGGHPFGFGGAFQNYGWYYPLFIGVAAVLASRSGVEPRKRLVLLAVGLPLTFLIHVAMIVASEGMVRSYSLDSPDSLRESTDALLFLGYAAHVGLLLTCWWRWHKTPQVEIETQQRRVGEPVPVPTGEG